MKKSFKWEKIAVAGTLVATLFAGAAPALAAAPGMEGKTDTNVGFVKGGHGTQTNPNGTLDLIYYPNKLNFGVGHTVDTVAEMHFSPINDSGVVEDTKYCVVRDLRESNPSTITSWKLMAHASELSSGGANVLSNATDCANYTFKGDRLKAYKTADGKDLVSPDMGSLVIHSETDLNQTHSATVDPNIKIKANGNGADAVVVMDSGTLVKDNRYAAELNNIQLNIPTGLAQEGLQYTGKITWEIVAFP